MFEWSNIEGDNTLIPVGLCTQSVLLYTDDLFIKWGEMMFKVAFSYEEIVRIMTYFIV